MTRFSRRRVQRAAPVQFLVTDVTAFAVRANRNYDVCLLLFTQRNPLANR